MTISVIMPNFNGARFLEEAIQSVIRQRDAVGELEFIVVDGGSDDGSRDILQRFDGDIDRVICEPDEGPADAINKGLAVARGDVLGWLNADDCYYPGALSRVRAAMTAQTSAAHCFGHCAIINEEGVEIRAGITRVKELFFPVSSRFTMQCINYVSQPGTFFRRTAYEAAGPLRMDLTAAWDYEFFLRIWRQGGAVRIKTPALAAFRWHEGSISGQHFGTQFKEEWEAAAMDAGRFSLQALIHLCVRWGIVASYSMMASHRKRVESGASTGLGSGDERRGP